METLETDKERLNSSVPIPWLDADTFYAIYKDLGNDVGGLPQKMRDWIEAYENIKIT